MQKHTTYSTGCILMRASSIIHFILSIFLTTIILPTSLQAEELIDQSSNIFNFQHKLADNGNVNAQFKLASMYEEGEGVAKNIDQAKHWYKIAAKGGSKPAAQRENYLRIKEKGFNAANDKVWLDSVTADAEAHDADAVYLLAQLYHDGVGVKKDLVKSLELFKEIKSLGEANVEKEIVSINREIAADKIARQNHKKKIELENRQAQRAREKQRVQSVQIRKQVKQVGQAVDTKQTMDKAQLIRAEKRKKYEAVMLKLKLEQEAIDKQQSLVTGGAEEDADDEI